MLCLARLEGMACRAGLTNPPICADPEMRSERGLPGQKCPIMPQLDQSCTELETKPLRHATDQTDLLNPSSELLPSLLQRPGNTKHQDSNQAGSPGTALGDIGTQQSPELTSCFSPLTATVCLGWQHTSWGPCRGNLKRTYARFSGQREHWKT